MAKINGHKKYIGIYGLLVAIFLALLKLLGSVHAKGAEDATVKSMAVTANQKATDSKLYAEQETSRLEATKLDKEIFRMHEQIQQKQFDSIEKGMDTQRKERREDTKQIMDLIKNGR